MPVDGQPSQERIVREIAQAMLDAAKLLPVQDDNRSIGSCSYNWWAHIARCLQGDAVQLESSYGPAFREKLASSLAAIAPPATGEREAGWGTAVVFKADGTVKAMCKGQSLADKEFDGFEHAQVTTHLYPRIQKIEDIDQNLFDKMTAEQINEALKDWDRSQP